MPHRRSAVAAQDGPIDPSAAAALDLLPGGSAPDALLAEIRAGLSQPQKELPPKFFYDQRGSELFEEITQLPEYYLTRTERALLEQRIPGWIGAQRPRALVELGAGSARKTRILLDAMRDAGGSHFFPVDISADFLAETAAALRAEYPELETVPVVGDIGAELAIPADLPRPALFAFLGSTIGNLSTADAVLLLRRVRAAMRPGDHFLLGADLRKHPAAIEAAYNDSRGVTAAFNLNMLRVLNAETGADFDETAFAHRAFYNAVDHRIEMHLVSLRDQQVSVPGAGTFGFTAGESLRTEISCKYDRAAIGALLGAAGLRLTDWMTDEQDRYALAVASL